VTNICYGSPISINKFSEVIPRTPLINGKDNFLPWLCPMSPKNRENEGNGNRAGGRKEMGKEVKRER
jgi:hypothetical protein